MQPLLIGIFQAYDIVIFGVLPANRMVDWLVFSFLLYAVWGRAPLDLLLETLRSLRRWPLGAVGVLAVTFWSPAVTATQLLDLRRDRSILAIEQGCGFASGADHSSRVDTRRVCPHEYFGALEQTKER